MAAPGPSLPLADLASIRGQFDVLAVTSAFLAVPFANHVYACDRRWWVEYHAAVRSRHPDAELWGHDDGAGRLDGVELLRIAGWPPKSGSRIIDNPGICLEPWVLHSGRNSGYQAINLAYHLGYRLVALVGFDMRCDDTGRQHFFGEYASDRLHKRSPYGEWIPLFRTIRSSDSFRVVNCTPGSALDAFEFRSLEDVRREWPGCLPP